jgi:hypothetical protein
VLFFVCGLTSFPLHLLQKHKTFVLGFFVVNLTSSVLNIEELGVLLALMILAAMRFLPPLFIFLFTFAMDKVVIFNLYK